eukprot:10546089-Ditylum_brightwellii.AAC.1
MQARSNGVAVDLNPHTLKFTHNETELRTKALVSPRTSNLVFVPFVLEGDISLDKITRMVQAQNDFLADQISITVTGILDVNNYMKADPDNNGKSLCIYLLYETGKDGTKLFTSIEMST